MEIFIYILIFTPYICFGLWRSRAQSKNVRDQAQGTGFESLISLCVAAFVLAMVLGFVRDVVHQLLSISDDNDLIFNIAWPFVIIIFIELYFMIRKITCKNRNTEM